MIRFNSIKASALLACIVLCVAQARAEDEPKSVAVAFSKAMSSGDKKGVHDLSVGTAAQIKTVDTMTDVVVTFKKFKEACDKKFGADNSLSKSMGAAMPDLADEAAKADYVIKGDMATAVDKTKPDEKDPMKLKKADGKWKVDLESMGEAAAMLPVMVPIMKALNEMIDEINAGKYKTAEEAAVAMRAKMQPPQK